MIRNGIDLLMAHNKTGRELFYTLRKDYGQRIGQAWFNTLSDEYCAQIRGTLFDPFYLDGPEAVACIIETLDHLTKGN